MSRFSTMCFPCPESLLARLDVSSPPFRYHGPSRDSHGYIALSPGASILRLSYLIEPSCPPRIGWVSTETEADHKKPILEYDVIWLEPALTSIEEPGGGRMV